MANLTPEQKDDVALQVDTLVERHGEWLAWMRDRWQDEKAYEPWARYEAVLRDHFRGLEVLKVNKVGVVIGLAHGMCVELRATARHIVADVMQQEKV